MISAALLILAMTPGVDDPIFRDGFEASGTCPDGRQVLANIAYAGDDSETIRYNVDVREWDNIWGHATVFDDTVPFPGRPNSAPIILNFGTTTYIAAHFHVPAGALPNTFGWLTHTEYNYGTDVESAISTACGDFDPTSQACYSAGASGQILFVWAVPPPGTFCALQPGADYYLNLRATNPDATGPDCDPAASTCHFGSANNISVP
jgi:hypothetical protein